MELEDRPILLVVDSRHLSSIKAGEVKIDRSSLIDHYVGYFESSNGDQFVAVGDYETGLMTVRSGLRGFEPYRIDSRPGERMMSLEMANALSEAVNLLNTYLARGSQMGGPDEGEARQTVDLLEEAVMDEEVLGEWPSDARRWLSLVWDVFEAEQLRRWITVPEAVERANKVAVERFMEGVANGQRQIKETTLYKRIERGKLPYRESGRTKLVRWSDIEKYLHQLDELLEE